MMKFMMVMILINFIFNKFSYYLIQMIFQNILFLMFFVFFMMFPLNLNNYWVKIYYNLGCDMYSMGLILLSLWILGLMLMMSLNNLMNLNYLIYVYIMNLMLIMLMFCFLSMNMIMFYIFFESSLIPVFMLILGWGFQIDRIQAGFYMMLYTLFGSLPLFLLIINLYLNFSSMMFMMIKIIDLNIYVYMMMMMAFLIKMPMYMFHLWLPKAHVEAPLSGSMILAGVMLKLGSYGMMRFMLIMMYSCLKFNKFILLFSLMGGIFSSMMCLCQMDMKMLVAYSSVVHMSILMSGMMTMYNFGYYGGYLMMISHGLCSSGLFCLVNINYERLGSRSLLMNKGLINFFPSLTLMWFFLCSSNMSFPPSLNLFSEIILLNSLISWSNKLIFILMIILFMSALYTLYLYSFSQHGLFCMLLYFMKSINLVEYLNLLMHWIPLNLIFLIMYIYL